MRNSKPQKFEVSIDQQNQLPHPGLGGYSEKEILDFDRDLDDEKKRTEGGDISRKKFSTHLFVQARYIPCVDEGIERFEEKEILQPRVQTEKGVPEEEFGQPCPECNSVLVIGSDGCAHCIPLTDQVVEAAPLSVENVSEVVEIADFAENQTRKKNRERTTKIPNIGKNGHTGHTSPHKTGIGWKPAMPIVQKVMKVGSREAHINDPVLQKKVAKIGAKKSRKNTIAKISKLEQRKKEREGIAKIKGKK